MPRTKAASIAAGMKAARTLKRKKVAQQIARKRKENTTGVSDFLSALKETNTSETCCIVCGESMKNTLDIHHIDGDRTNSERSNKITICASCHRILDKAKSPMEARVDLEKRHRKSMSRSF
jgi:cytochrome c553